MPDSTGSFLKILGVNTRYYPNQFDQFNPPPTVAVLVAGDIGDYTCYVGHGDPNWVAQWGDKISFEEACAHFPMGQLKKELYRD